MGSYCISLGVGIPYPNASVISTSPYQLTDVSSLLIPEFSGQGTMTGQLQSATIKRYLALSAVGLSMFYFSSQSSVRTAGLSLLFPGAGCLAAGGIAGTLGFLVSVAFLPVALFAWFGAGGLAFPLADWVLSGIFATWLAGRRTAIVESSPIVTLGLLAVIFTYCKTRSITEEEGELAAKARRNRFLERADKEWRANARPASLPGSRELSLEQLRFVQHSLELMMKDHNDWEGHTIVDQFQPAALRYQFYETLYMLATYGTIYTPCFQGYLSAAMQNAIEKSLTPRVMGFWRLETLWGKFSTVRYSAGSTASKTDLCCRIMIQSSRTTSWSQGTWRWLSPCTNQSLVMTATGKTGPLTFRLRVRFGTSTVCGRSMKH